MAKGRRPVGLSFVLLRFAVAILLCMLLCCLAWLVGMTRLQDGGIVYRPVVSSQQVEAILAGEPRAFVPPGDDFLAEYALFGPGGELLQSNVSGRKLEGLAGILRGKARDTTASRHTYADGSTAVFRWHWRAEFVNPALRAILPPFETLWLAALAVALVLCLVLNTLGLRRRLAAKLRLFSEVSARVGAQELDFTVPRAGIREFDQGLCAMERMRAALYDALSAQWAAQQRREAEIAALAHDLKTPLTLVGGNAELLLDEELPAGGRRMAETILASSDRARRYVASLLETAAGADEAFEGADLPGLFDELRAGAEAIAEAKGVRLRIHNGLEGAAGVQRARWLRGLGNVVQNAVEHTNAGGTVTLYADMSAEGWRVVVGDEGPGFSQAALSHGTERLWRGDAARGTDGHDGLGLWFAAEVVSAHGGALHLRNGDAGGIVEARFPPRECDSAGHGRAPSGPRPGHEKGASKS